MVNLWIRYSDTNWKLHHRSSSKKLIQILGRLYYHKVAWFQTSGKLQFSHFSHLKDAEMGAVPCCPFNKHSTGKSSYRRLNDRSWGRLAIATLCWLKKLVLEEHLLPHAWLPSWNHGLPCGASRSLYCPGVHITVLWARLSLGPRNKSLFHSFFHSFFYSSPS